jgi:hypothetical protein
VFKQISNMTKFFCPNKSIYYFFKINTKIERREVRTFLGYFVWKITILRQKNHIFSNCRVGARNGCALPPGSAQISNMTKFYCPNKSIYYFFKINTKISTSFRRSMLISFWIDVPGADPGGRAHLVRAPTLKLEKNMIFWRKIVVFRNSFFRHLNKALII